MPIGPGIKREIKEGTVTPQTSLDYDKFLGTLGLAADKPVGTQRPHYTTFPATAAKGNWVRVVSDTTIGTQKITDKEEWMCVIAKTEDKSATWELVQEGSKKLTYTTYSNSIGVLTRYLDTRTTINIPIASGITTYIGFFSPIATGVFDNAQTKNSTATYTFLSDLIANENIKFDIQGGFNFADDRAGTRIVSMVLQSFYPEGTVLNSIFLESFSVDSDQRPPLSILKLNRINLNFPTTEPLDEFPITYAIRVRLFQDSGVALKPNFGEFTIRAWG